MDARTEAAEEAMRNHGIGGSTYLDLAKLALAAADAVEAPLAEQLAACLRFYANPHRWEDGFFTERVETNRDSFGSEVDFTAIPDNGARARDALAVFDAARADSQGTATKEET